MQKFQYIGLLTTLFFLMSCTSNTANSSAVKSFDTGFTITNVSTAQGKTQQYIVASSYEGTILAYNFDGSKRWQQPLSGYMNHDVFSADITQDGIDEILIANADGNIYVLNHLGELLWSFKENDVPMNAITVIKHQDKSYVVAGGYDTYLYYLDKQGNKVKTLDTVNFAKARVFTNGKGMPEKNRQSINFLKTLKQADGTELLAMHGTNNSMQVPGELYIFKPLTNKPLQRIKVGNKKPIGELRVVDANNDGFEDLLFGSSTTVDRAEVLLVDVTKKTTQKFSFKKLRKKLGGNGYRVAQSELILDGDKKRNLTLFGNHILINNNDLSKKKPEILSTQFSYYDISYHSLSNTLLLASAQSGGSAIHLLNLNHSSWKKAYQTLQPTGKIAKVIANSAKARQQLTAFSAPPWQRDPVPVYLMTENLKKFDQFDLADFKKDYPHSPIFFENLHMPKVENWDRSAMHNKVYQKKRDRRKKYVLSQKQVLAQVAPLYREESQGAAFWAGHGNDPYMFSLDTNKKILDNAQGKPTVFIYPELESTTDDFAWVMDDLFYPLAAYAKDKNGKIYVRTKHTFWQSMIYKPLWSGLVSGEYADVFIPSMEETTDKSMELSIAARMGVWLSGSVNQWGARSARDNPSFDRMRQFSHQMLPNHFLRQMIYNISNGATYINNFPVDQNYMSFLWELIAKGALYVPKREELLHISPVHVSMLAPDNEVSEEGHNVKWTSFYHPDKGEGQPLVFDRLNGTWPGAKNTEWDFSRYAAGVKDRRQHFLPPYPHGIVLLTPPQKNADVLPRGLLKNKLHPLYDQVLTEYLTDGKYYYNADKTQKYSADSFYHTIEKSIKDKAKLLPLTVSGKVAWTLAQITPTQLRLTLIDGGYLNPNDQIAKLQLNNIKVKKMTDVLSGKTFKVSNNKQLEIPVKAGLFRFIDIELTSALN